MVGPLAHLHGVFDVNVGDFVRIGVIVNLLDLRYTAGLVASRPAASAVVVKRIVTSLEMAGGDGAATSTSACISL